MPKTLTATLVLLFFIIASADFARASDDSLFFTDVEKYNQEQVRRAEQFYILPDLQLANACVCNTAANIAGALIGSQTETRNRVSQCASGKVNFALKYMNFKKEFPGTLFGGLVSKLDNQDFVFANDALQVVIESIDNGQVAAVALNAAPVYKDYVNRNNISSKNIPNNLNDKLGINHAVVVIGVLRDENWDVRDFIVADSSGPERKYVVSRAAFKKGYSSFHAKAARGVFIPIQAIHSPIKYMKTINTLRKEST